jgi:hypothetical protein
MVKSGAKSLGRTKTKRGADKIFAREYKRENACHIVKIGGYKRRRR